MFRIIYTFFDKLEDRVRRRFSHYPILYAIVGGVGVVLFWRGVWHSTDYGMAIIHARRLGLGSIDQSIGAWWDGPLSLVVGTIVLLMTGIFVSSFIGNEIIMSGLRGERKLTEKTEKEVKLEVGAIAEILERLERLSKKIDSLESRSSIAKASPEKQSQPAAKRR
ncbi:MAG: hypothetical protein ACM3NH_00835 [Candidatus Saccharibacteria bacterium]